MILIGYHRFSLDIIDSYHPPLDSHHPTIPSISTIPKIIEVLRVRVENTQKVIGNAKRMDTRDAKAREIGAFRRLENARNFQRGWKPR